MPEALEKKSANEGESEDVIGKTDTMKATMEETSVEDVLSGTSAISEQATPAKLEADAYDDPTPKREAALDSSLHTDDCEQPSKAGAELESAIETLDAPEKPVGKLVSESSIWDEVVDHDGHAEVSGELESGIETFKAAEKPVGQPASQPEERQLSSSIWDEVVDHDGPAEVEVQEDLKAQTVRLGEERDMGAAEKISATIEDTMYDSTSETAVEMETSTTTAVIPDPVTEVGLKISNEDPNQSVNSQQEDTQHATEKLEGQQSEADGAHHTSEPQAQVEDASKAAQVRAETQAGPSSLGIHSINRGPQVPHTMWSKRSKLC